MWSAVTHRDPAYSAYARHYDEIGQRNFGEESVTLLLAHLAALGHRPSTALDLACGTGAATVPLARAGLAVTGLDRSEAMLAVARTRASAENISITWVCGDMRLFSIDTPVDLITCFYDAVNYLDGPGDFGQFAASAFTALRPGGLLAFDINTRRKLAEHWQDSTVVAANTSERFIIYQSWFDEAANNSPLVITIFEKQPDGTWLRFDEEHIEYAFSIEFVRSTLAETGFSAIQVLQWREGDPNGPSEGTESSLRVLFLATKPEGNT